MKKFNQDKDYITAVASLKTMDKGGLQFAFDGTMAAQVVAIQQRKFDIAVELTAMRGEVIKEMANRLNDAEGHAPQGLTIKQAHKKIDHEINEEIKALEAL